MLRKRTLTQSDAGTAHGIFTRDAQRACECRTATQIERQRRDVKLVPRFPWSALSIWGMSALPPRQGSFYGMRNLAEKATHHGMRRALN